MAFTFNPADIKFSGATTLEFGGVYNVTIEEAKVAPKAKNGEDQMTVKFVVDDGQYKGASINHFFMDDSEMTKYQPFRYREIGALIAATGVVQPGQSADVNSIAPALAGKKVSVAVNKFKRSEKTDPQTGKKSVNYFPEINDIQSWQVNGSQVDNSIVNPKNTNQGQQSNGFSNGAPLPPEPQQDAFGGGF
ncbi:DUF669 domain-containing protein [Weissella tructae]|uniref:DUF669 domain-containing protein n=1 Tax=Weissella tructae TaxID=887702 RepID=UPI001BDCE281|nr:DUF669 domain-containing protein [Weissella tructae]QVV90848.1 DUF669 domain-containing protein [Weissella tructae]